ncbi:MAG: hypothetical protein U0271_04445 [Polyangiaceae bacterium]
MLGGLTITTPAAADPDAAAAAPAEETPAYVPPKGVPDRIGQTKFQYPVCDQSKLSAEQKQANTDAAKNAHQAALKAYEDKDWEKAARLWTEAYSFDCSRPRVFLNIGDAFERAGHAHAAVAMYLLLKERVAPSDLPEGVDLDEKLERLMAIVRKEDAIEAEEIARRAAEADKGPMVKPLGVAPWVVVGVGAAVIVAGAVLVPYGLIQAGDAADRCGDPAARTFCPQEAVDDGEAGELMSQIGQGLLYGGAGIAALGIVLEFAANTPRYEEKAKPPAPNMQVYPIIGPGTYALSWSGTF